MGRDKWQACMKFAVQMVAHRKCSTHSVAIVIVTNWMHSDNSGSDKLKNCCTERTTNYSAEQEVFQEDEKSSSKVFLLCMKFIPAESSQQMVLWNVKSTSKRRVTEKTKRTKGIGRIRILVAELKWKSSFYLLLWTEVPRKKQTKTSSQQQWKHPTLLNILQGQQQQQ